MAKKKAKTDGHPNPDERGRYKCKLCGDYTVNASRRHLWCEIGWAAWDARIQAAMQEQSSE